MNSADDFTKRVEAAIKNPKNLGELVGADAVGTVGSEECGDMLRMWVKFKEVEGKRVIDKATFQTFGCETAIAVASLATELISGKTVEEALNMSGDDLAAPLGPLPPLKIHCAQLVEGALRSALAPNEKKAEGESLAPTLLQQFQGPKQESKRIILGSSNERRS
jgi:NifU-like protein involved in Fe-S cluster formation